MAVADPMGLLNWLINTQDYKSLLYLMNKRLNWPVKNAQDGDTLTLRHLAEKQLSASIHPHQYAHNTKSANNISASAIPTKNKNMLTFEKMLLNAPKQQKHKTD